MSVLLGRHSELGGHMSVRARTLVLLTREAYGEKHSQTLCGGVRGRQGGVCMHREKGTFLHTVKSREKTSRMAGRDTRNTKLRVPIATPR